MDNDRWVIPKWNSWCGPFHIIFNGKHFNVLRHSSIPVSLNENFACDTLNLLPIPLISAACGQLFSFFITNSSDLQDYLGGAYAIQYFFAGVSIVAFFFGLLFLPETHGKKLSEIEAYFKGKSSKKTKPGTGKKVVNNRKPKQPVFKLQTVNESEKMMNGSDNVWRSTQTHWMNYEMNKDLFYIGNSVKQSA